MDHYFECIVNHSLKIKNYIFTGTITVDTLIENVSKTIMETINSYDYNILVDIREAEFPDFLRKMNDYTGFLIEASKVINMRRKCAIVTAKPDDVVVAELMKIKLNEVNFDLRIEIFSTREAAFFWLI